MAEHDNPTGQELPTWFSESGNSGLRQFSGYVLDDDLKKLQGRAGVQAFREMADNDATIGSMLFLIKQTIRRVTWRVEDAETENPGQKKQAEFFGDFARSLMDDMEHPWEDLITEASTMLEYGFAPMEVVYKIRQGDTEDPATKSEHADGYIGLRKVSLRAQETLFRWEFDDKGEAKGMWQQPWTGGVVYIDLEKMCLFRTTSIRNNPEGRSILRNAYRAWYLKKTMERIEGVGVERDLAGFPIIYMPSKLIAAAQGGKDSKALATYNAYKMLVRNLRRDEQEGAIMPSDVDDKGNKLFELTLLTSGSRREFNVGAIIDRYKQEMMQSTMTDFTMLGHGARGTQALATTKVDVFLDSIQGYVDIMGAVFNRQLLPRLWQLNGFPMQFMPKFVPDDAKNVDLQALTGLITALVGAGMPMFPDPELESWVRDQAGLPEPSPELLAQRQQMEQLMASGAGGLGLTRPAAPLHGGGANGSFQDSAVGNGKSFNDPTMGTQPRAAVKMPGAGGGGFPQQKPNPFSKPAPGQGGQGPAAAVPGQPGTPTPGAAQPPGGAPGSFGAGGIKPVQQPIKPPSQMVDDADTTISDPQATGYDFDNQQPAPVDETPRAMLFNELWSRRNMNKRGIVHDPSQTQTSGQQPDPTQMGGAPPFGRGLQGGHHGPLAPRTIPRG